MARPRKNTTTETTKTATTKTATKRTRATTRAKKVEAKTDIEPTTDNPISQQDDVVISQENSNVKYECGDTVIFLETEYKVAYANETSGKIGLVGKDFLSVGIDKVFLIKKATHEEFLTTFFNVNKSNNNEFITFTNNANKYVVNILKHTPRLQIFRNHFQYK